MKSRILTLFFLVTDKDTDKKYKLDFKYDKLHKSFILGNDKQKFSNNVIKFLDDFLTTNRNTRNILNVIDLYTNYYNVKELE